MLSETIEIPIIIGGKEIHTDDIAVCKIPHHHQHHLGTYHQAGTKEVEMAIDSSLEAWKTWSKSSLKKRK